MKQNGLQHLDRVEGGKYIKGRPRDDGKPPIKDYLKELREKRETKNMCHTEAEKIKIVIKDKKLSKLEKLNMVKEETRRLEMMAKQHPISLSTALTDQLLQ